MTPSEAYEIFVGSCTAEEFVAPFNGNVDAAIAQHLEEPFDPKDFGGITPPEGLGELIRQYVIDQLDDQA